MVILEKYSLGVGDRFARQAKAQLQACAEALDAGVEIIPVWNKSNREHTTIGSDPAGVRQAADQAVQALNWRLPYHVDADHINQRIVDPFLETSDFFTLDVADWIGKPADAGRLNAFIDRHSELIGAVEIEGLQDPLEISREQVEAVAGTYLKAVEEAAAIQRYLESKKGNGNFITEVSMDETEVPQTPRELLVILAALSDFDVPLQTIAPKFTGRFNKGVDYVGDLEQFEKEFSEDLAVLAHAVRRYGLPNTLKLSVHSGSDKFSLYPVIHRCLRRADSGVHLKTAGTTWLEELIGLAEAGGGGLELAKEIYARALEKIDELCAPYAAVIDIDRNRLPSAEEVKAWTSEAYVGALRHEPGNGQFNPSLRQLLHVGYKIAAKMGDRYLTMVESCEASISRNVTENLLNRHIQPLFQAKP